MSFLQSIGSVTFLNTIAGNIINKLIVDCDKELSAKTATLTHDLHSPLKITDTIARIYNDNIIWTGLTGDNNTPHNHSMQKFIRV
jgi:ABC-type transporter Mla maintaining outer membrane lipid asymmetry ATPase subunit MlaF